MGNFQICTLFSEVNFKNYIKIFTVTACFVAHDMQVIGAEVSIEKDSNSQMGINFNTVALIPAKPSSETEYRVFRNVHFSFK